MAMADMHEGILTEFAQHGDMARAHTRWVDALTVREFDQHRLERLLVDARSNGVCVSWGCSKPAEQGYRCVACKRKLNERARQQYRSDAATREAAKARAAANHKPTGRPRGRPRKAATIQDRLGQPC